MTPSPEMARLNGWQRFMLVMGPGLVVMLADTDAGSIITAAQSGAQWGYKLLALQFILMPILYIVQELTVRLGLVTGKGHAQLIQQHFGTFWAWFSVATLVLSCIGAVLSELSGLSGVGTLMGIPAPVTMVLVVAALLIMAFTHSYLTVERIAIGIGAFELVFLLVAWLAQPSFGEIAVNAFNMPVTDSKYLYLVSANIGAVIMPWMVFFQQSSLVEKQLSARDLPAARLDTVFGAILTQLIMAAVLIATAATIGKTNGDQALDTVQQISDALTPFLGNFGGKLLFGLGMNVGNLVGSRLADWSVMGTIGGMLVFNIVVMCFFSLTAAHPALLCTSSFLIGCTFAAGPATQTRLMDVASDGQTLAAASMHSAFNIANGLGAWLGGLVIASGHGFAATGYVGAAMSFFGLFVFAASLWSERGEAVAKPA